MCPVRPPALPRAPAPPARPWAHGRGGAPRSGKFVWTVRNLALFREMIKTQKIMSPAFPAGECSLRLSVYQSTVAGADFLSLCLESKARARAAAGPSLPRALNALAAARSAHTCAAKHRLLGSARPLCSEHARACERGAITARDGAR